MTQTIDRASGKHPEFIGTEELAKVLGVCRQTVANLVTEGEIPAVQVGRQYKYILADVLSALDTKVNKEG